MRCEERGDVQVKGITQPVATYAVLGLKQDEEQAATAHLRLEVDAERMSEAQGAKAAADVLGARARLARKKGWPIAPLCVARRTGRFFNRQELKAAPSWGSESEADNPTGGVAGSDRQVQPPDVSS